MKAGNSDYSSQLQHSVDLNNGTQENNPHPPSDDTGEARIGAKPLAQILTPGGQRSFMRPWVPLHPCSIWTIRSITAQSWAGNPSKKCISRGEVWSVKVQNGIRYQEPAGLFWHMLQWETAATWICVSTSEERLEIGVEEFKSFEFCVWAPHRLPQGRCPHTLGHPPGMWLWNHPPQQQSLRSALLLSHTELGHKHKMNTAFDQGSTAKFTHRTRT